LHNNKKIKIRREVITSCVLCFCGDGRLGRMWRSNSF